MEEYLEANCLDGEQFALLNGKPIQQAYFVQDKMTDYSKVSRFGMMFKPLTESLGKELLMSYQEDFPVKTYPQPEKVQELMVNAPECGKKWLASFVKYDLNLSLWKTHQCSFIEDSEQFLGTWPSSGSMQNGECLEHQTLELNITEREFGLLPDNERFFHTPNTTGIDGGSNSRKALKKRKEAIWPTPTTPSGGGNAGGSGAHKNAVKNGTYIPSSINPSLYEWLMGWPLEWTDLKPLEMDKFHKWLELHGNY